MSKLPFNLKKLAKVGIPALILILLALLGGLVWLVVYLAVKLALYITIIVVTYLVFVLPAQYKNAMYEPEPKKKKPAKVTIPFFDDVLKFKP